MYSWSIFLLSSSSFQLQETHPPAQQGSRDTIIQKDRQRLNADLHGSKLFGQAAKVAHHFKSGDKLDPYRFAWLEDIQCRHFKAGTCIGSEILQTLVHND